jgi:DNA-binding ferritin-like protein
MPKLNKEIKKNNISVNSRNLQKIGQDVIVKFLEMLNLIKLYHWKTYKYSTHKATDELYSRLNENFDQFVERLLGKSKERVNLMKMKSIPLYDLKDVKELIKKVKTFQTYLINMNKKLDPLLDSDLLNIRDEILGDLNQFLYLLTLC